VRLWPRSPWRWAAIFAIPLAGVVNYTRLHTPELAQLSASARSATLADAVFLFPDAAHGCYPGIFRSEALRAVYVDWKGGGKVHYVGHYNMWWFRRATVWRGRRRSRMPATGCTISVAERIEWLGRS
jgi:hypothetical protein